MPAPNCLAVILAAGEGTRMKSVLPKVLHRIGGWPMVAHAARAALGAGCERLGLVVGPGMEPVAAAVRAVTQGSGAAVDSFTQGERLGTAHALLQARRLLAAAEGDVVTLYGDTPLVTPETILRLRAHLAAGADVVVLGFLAADPTGYGRLITDEGRLVAIREERDASAAERSIRLCNSGIMAFRGPVLLDLLRAVGNANAKGEYYLTDAVAIAVARGLRVAYEIADEAEVMGVNDRAQLAACESVFQSRARARALAAGVTLTAPDTVFFSADTDLKRDVTVEPNVVFGLGVRVGEEAVIRAFSHLEGAEVAPGAIVGPFARLRPGARIGRDAHVGNFVEVKNASLGTGAKANHLAYLGDAEIGAGTNVGAGTITCNYDGFAKHRTTIGADVFIGSNATLVAPVSVGEGAYVAAGSVVTDPVPADALALGRARQTIKEERGRRLRERLRAAKDGKDKSD